jgi:hypothetical protein
MSGYRYQYATFHARERLRQISKHEYKIQRLQACLRKELKVSAYRSRVFLSLKQNIWELHLFFPVGSSVKVYLYV